MARPTTFKRANPIPDPPANNVYRVRLIGALEEQQTMSTFFYADAKPKFTGTYLDCADLFSGLDLPVTGLFSRYKEVMVSTWGGERVLIDLVTDPTILTHETVTNTWVGIVPGPHKPIQSATTIAKFSLWKGQHGRGRISLPGVPDAWAVNTALVNPVTNYGDFAAAMKAVVTYNGKTWRPGIYSTKKLDDGSKINGWIDLIATVVRTTLGTCRSRKPGVGV